jgi:hypothetical protein
VKITKEDFEAWKANPITEAYFRFASGIMAKAKADWMNASWNSEAIWRDGSAAELRAACRARHECAADLIERIDEEDLSDGDEK